MEAAAAVNLFGRGIFLEEQHVVQNVMGGYLFIRYSCVCVSMHRGKIAERKERERSKKKVYN